jgi:glutamine amidotransferase
MKPLKITIIDFASGNLNALVKKLSDFGYDSEYTSDPNAVEKASFLMIPGVGHFKTAMGNLTNNNLPVILTEKVINQKTPVIGICLGMQLFSNYSEEGSAHGLGWIDAETRLLRFTDQKVKVPHIGWNNICWNDNKDFYTQEQIDHRYYFVHSYHVMCNNSNDILSLTEYGNVEFCSSIKHDNIIGFQFHPEKSHKKGMKMLAMAIDYLNNNYGK